MTNPAPLSHGPLLSYPGSPNGRVATAGECKYHPVLPVNYTTKKLIVRGGAHLRDVRLPVDGAHCFNADAEVCLFSHTPDLMPVNGVKDETALEARPPPPPILYQDTQFCPPENHPKCRYISQTAS